MTRGSTLVAFDFDGTLAPICEDPADVQLCRGASVLLHELSRVQGVTVAIASGRDAEDIASRTDASDAYVIGSHGLEIRAPGGILIRDLPPLHARVGRVLLQAIAENGLRLEVKKHGVALHWRGQEWLRIRSILDRFRQWARRESLDIIEGRCVVEARHAGSGKEDALRWLSSATGAAQVIYAGDDMTDFGALRFAAQHGRAIFIANSEWPSPPGVTVVDSFLDLMRLIRAEVLV